MDHDEKTLWNRKYSEHPEHRLQPDPFLASAYSEFIAGCAPGKALDVAGAMGRHAIWLAERGWQVTLMDISEVGVELARNNIAARPNLRGDQLDSAGRIDLEVVDLRSKGVLSEAKFDLVLVFLYLQRSLFPALMSALKPGGFLLYKTFTLDQQRFCGGPKSPDHLLKPGELLRAFAPLRVLHYHETVQNAGLAELVARKSG